MPRARKILLTKGRRNGLKSHLGLVYIMVWLFRDRLRVLKDRASQRITNWHQRQGQKAYAGTRIPLLEKSMKISSRFEGNAFALGLVGCSVPSPVYHTITTKNLHFYLSCLLSNKRNHWHFYFFTNFEDSSHFLCLMWCGRSQPWIRTPSPPQNLGVKSQPWFISSSHP